MILSFRSVAGITAKFTAAVTNLSGGEIEELMHSVSRGHFGWNSTRKHQATAKP